MSSRRCIALSDLLAATGLEQRDLWDLRARGLFPFKPGQTYPKGNRGSASEYPREALDYLQYLANVQRQFRRNADEWVWRMWLAPADWSIDMRKWVIKRLDRMSDVTMRAKAKRFVVRPGAEHQLPGASRVRNQKSRRVAWDWMVAWALGNERPDLYSAFTNGLNETSVFDLLLKLAGPPFAEMSVPRAGGRREKVSERGGPYLLARFRRIVAVAPDRDIEQARRDWRAISALIEAAERVDWNKAPALGSIGTKPEPPSWAARKARRVRPKPAPDFIRLPIADWKRSYDFRALLFSALLIARRLFSRSSVAQVPDFILAITNQWIEGLPRIAGASSGRIRR